MAQEIIQLAPEALLADDNSRFGLKASRIETLMQSILQEGRVLVPLEVEPTETPDQYRVRMGHYRHAAVTRLNKNGAGLTLPCVVVQPNGDTLRTLVAENYERQDYTPMDTAIAIQRLKDAGLSIPDIRTMFSRPGGRKGNKVAPASNSFVNIHLSFLDLPKSVQNMLHDGRITVTGGMELVKVQQKNPDKLADVLAKLEEERLQQIATEEALEESYQKEEEKAAEAKAKLDALAATAQEAAAKLQETSKQFDETARLEIEAFNVAESPDLSEDEKKAANKAYKEAQNATKGLAKAVDLAKREKERLEARLSTAQQSAEERKAKLEAARKEAEKRAKKAATEGKGKKKASGAADVQKAAKEVGAESNTVPLKAPEMRKYVEGLTIAGPYPKVQQIGQALTSAFAGVGTEKTLFTALAKITGEWKK